MVEISIKDEVGTEMGVARVMRSGRYVGLELANLGVTVYISLDADELAQLVSALVTVQAEVIAQNRPS